MGSQQQFCLRWNNHQTNLLSVFDDLLQHETLVDVTLACEGLSMRAHKVVLSACSPYFQQLFLENPCKHPIVVLKDVSYTDMKTLIDFMYKGEVNVSHDQLSTLLNVADTLKVKGLAEVTEGMAATTRRNDAAAAEMSTSINNITNNNSSGGGGGASRRGGGAISPTTARRRKKRRTSGGSNSGHSEDVDVRSGQQGIVTSDLNKSDTMTHKQRLPHSLDLPVVPKLEVILPTYDDDDEEHRHRHHEEDDGEEGEGESMDMSSTLRVLDVRSGREVHGVGSSASKVGDGPSTHSSSSCSSASYSRLNPGGAGGGGGTIETTKDRHRRDDNGIDDDEKYTTLNDDDDEGGGGDIEDDDGIEITDLPFTQHLTIEQPTASTSSGSMSMMVAGPSTSSIHPNAAPNTTDLSLYFPSTSATSSSSLPMYDASNLPSASNTQVYEMEVNRDDVGDGGCGGVCDEVDPAVNLVSNQYRTGLVIDLKMREARFPRLIKECFKVFGLHAAHLNKKAKMKVECLMCSKLLVDKRYNKKMHLYAAHRETYDGLLDKD